MYSSQYVESTARSYTIASNKMKDYPVSAMADALVGETRAWIGKKMHRIEEVYLVLQMRSLLGL